MTKYIKNLGKYNKNLIKCHKPQVKPIYTIQVEYSRIIPIESYLCEYNNHVWNTKENLATFPDKVTLFNPMSKQTFVKITHKLFEALNTGRL